MFNFWRVPPPPPPSTPRGPRMRVEVGGEGGRDKMAAPGGGSVDDDEAEPVLGRLEEEARRRQERLRALRQRAMQNNNSGEPETKKFKEDEEEETVKHREIILRNYDPEDEELKKRKLPPAKPASVEDNVKDQLEAAKPEPIIDEVDLTNLAPRKPDWDLKRDVAKKMEKLEKRTQRAIAELIRERLKGQEEELAAAVGSAKQDGSDSD
ncbi:coiled-coil domain-containing protein 12 [Excalfactoria chinensis]|uniref:coiled-coil domain-containing protein 12 n=1 Tax=Excalfactoria chinensis TaxID=46218 RepID=UPI003B3A5212